MNEDDCQNLIQITEAFERTTRKEKAERMTFVFQLRNGMEVVQLASYKNGVTDQQANEKEKTARLHTDAEIRVTVLTIRGLKRKSFRKETVGEKADRGQRAKKALIDSLWKAKARKEKETTETAKRKEGNIEEKKTKAKPGPKKAGLKPEKVKLAMSKDSLVASSRLAKMWADQCSADLNQIPLLRQLPEASKENCSTRLEDW